MNTPDGLSAAYPQPRANAKVVTTHEINSTPGAVPDEPNWISQLNVALNEVTSNTYQKLTTLKVSNTKIANPFLSLGTKKEMK